MNFVEEAGKQNRGCCCTCFLPGWIYVCVCVCTDVLHCSHCVSPLKRMWVVCMASWRTRSRPCTCRILNKPWQQIIYICFFFFWGGGVNPTAMVWHALMFAKRMDCEKICLQNSGACEMHLHGFIITWNAKILSASMGWNWWIGLQLVCSCHLCLVFRFFSSFLLFPLSHSLPACFWILFCIPLFNLAFPSCSGQFCSSLSLSIFYFLHIFIYIYIYTHTYLSISVCLSPSHVCLLGVFSYFSHDAQ